MLYPFTLPMLAAYSANSFAKIIIPLLFLLILSGLLVAALAFVRKKMHGEQYSSTSRDFSLGDLRDLHREGKLTAEEFERAKEKLIGSVRQSLKKEAKPSMVEKPAGEELKDG